MGKEALSLRRTLVFGLGATMVSFAAACGGVRGERSLGIQFTKVPTVRALTPEEFLAFHREERILFTGEYSLDFCFQWPVMGPVTSYFGEEVGGGAQHTGLDIDTDMGTPVLAAYDGKIEKATSDGYAYGLHIIVNHGGGIETLYAHLSAVNVVDQEEVQRGQMIGAVGSTGYSSGPHLHFEIRTPSFYLDPLNYLKNKPGQCNRER